MQNVKSWPQCLGMQASEAQTRILNECPQLQVLIIQQDSMVTMDYREDRVRIFVDPSNKVASIPSTG